VRVERTLVAVGLILSMLGLIVAVDGYTYVNVERGPPLMVCGVLVFCAGLVLAGQGFVLRELQSISADASKAALMLAKSRPPAASTPEFGLAPPNESDKLPPLAPFQPPVAPFQPPQAPFQPPQASAPEEPLEATWSSAPQVDRRPDEQRPQQPQQQPASAPGFGRAFAEPFALEDDAEPEEKNRRPALPPAPVFDLAKPGKMQDPPPLAWMIRPEPSEPVVAKLEWEKPEIASEAPTEKKGERAAQEGERALAEEFGLTEPEHAAEEPEAPKPEVIGHYEAHGAHYTMYADGSIEAETQHGVYRFANIDELKRFIEGET
jgi:hypothetical protein